MDSNTIYYVASILDPRIKARYLIANHPDGNGIVTKIKDYIHEVYSKPPLVTRRMSMDKDFGEFSIQNRMLMVS